MARSIHDTWGVLHSVLDADWSDPAYARDLEQRARRNLRHQRALKRGERRVRELRGLAPAPRTAATIPIYVEQGPPYLFHPLTEEDVRGLLARVPPGTLDGLVEVRLTLDRTPPEGVDTALDPFLRKQRFEWFPGVFASDTFGVYYRVPASISVHAVTCEPGTLGPLATYLKLHALDTLLHEAAHHFDLTFRVRRSRWDLNSKEHKERYAEERQEALSGPLAVTFLRERYPAECAELEAWLLAHGGARLALERLGERGAVSQPRLRSALEKLAAAARRGDPPASARVAYARSLHLAGEDGCALEALDSLAALGEEPGEALAARACVHLCRRRELERARQLCEVAVGKNPESPEVWLTLARLEHFVQRWQAMLDASEQGLSRCDEGAPQREQLQHFVSLARKKLRSA